MIYQSKVELARVTIEKMVREGRVLVVKEAEVPPAWREMGACFVTLKKEGKLRGCIGSIEAQRPLYQDIIDNAMAAAIHDWRFAPVTESELAELVIEVSVLTKPQPCRPATPEALLRDLGNQKPGLIVEKEGQRAVFLPQVWEELPEPEQFLSHLCLKAGLPGEAWRAGMQFSTFQVTIEK